MLLGINPFDQFGVELGKEMARQLADRRRTRTSLDSDRRARIDAKGRGRLMADYDLFVIGAGSGGVRASRVAAAHGARVAIAEEYQGRRHLRDPRLRAQEAARLRRAFRRGSDDAAMFGWDVPKKRFDWPVLRDNVLAEVDRLERRLHRDADQPRGRDLPRARDAHRAQLGPRSRAARRSPPDKILIATGARPVMPEIAGHRACASARTRCSTSKSCPKRIMIAGGGYIANEFAGIFHQFGSQVTLVNRTDVLLRHYDQQIVDRLLQISLRKGIDFKFNATIDKIERARRRQLHVSMTGCDDIEVDLLLFATGRQPNTEGLGLEAGRSRARRERRDQGRRGQSHARCRRSSRSAT